MLPFDAARMAELTTPAPLQTDPVVSAQLAAVRDGIKEMNKKWQQRTVTSLKGGEEEEISSRINSGQGALRGRGGIGYVLQQQRTIHAGHPLRWTCRSCLRKCA